LIAPDKVSSDNARSTQVAESNHSPRYATLTYAARSDRDMVCLCKGSAPSSLGNAKNGMKLAGASDLFVPMDFTLSAVKISIHGSACVIVILNRLVFIVR
jgi:hypothetical protein